MQTEVIMQLLKKAKPFSSANTLTEILFYASLGLMSGFLKGLGFFNSYVLTIVCILLHFTLTGSTELLN